MSKRVTKQETELRVPNAAELVAEYFCPNFLFYNNFIISKSNLKNF